jgi:hypothetical protein
MPKDISGTGMEDSLKARLLALELQLMDPGFRKNREKVSAVLAENFCEFGASGRSWTRNTILEMLVSEADYRAPLVKEFAMQVISPEAVLVTYRTVRAATESNSQQDCLRSSVWILRDGSWKVLFHQGTKVSPV